MKFISHFPLFIFVFLAYNLVIFVKKELVLTEVITVQEAPAEIQAPAETTEAPAETTDAPAETTDAPAETTDAPAETTDAPAQGGTDQPAEAEAGEPASAAEQDPLPDLSEQEASSMEKVTILQPKPLFEVQLPSDAVWRPTMGDFLIIFAILVLYVELFKSTKTGSATIVEHVFSLFVFLGFGLEFLLVERAGSSTFLIVTILSFVDVVAGFTITISTARRDFGLGAHGAPSG